MSARPSESHRGGQRRDAIRRLANTLYRYRIGRAEAAPVQKRPDDKLIGGTVNGIGTLVAGDVAGLTHALGRTTMRNIRKNLFFACIYNALNAPVAAGVLYAVFGIPLSPVIAALSMSMRSGLVVGNALRRRGLRF